MTKLAFSKGKKTGKTLKLFDVVEIAKTVLMAIWSEERPITDHNKQKEPRFTLILRLNMTQRLELLVLYTLKT